MKTVTGLSILCFIMLFSLTSYSQWFDSVKHVAAIQKNDTNKVQTLIHLSDAYAFSYPDTAFVYGQQAYALSEKLDYDNGRLYSIISINSALYGIMPWISFKNMNDEDLRAIYSYLRTFPSAKHSVNSQLPFTHCAICGMDHGLGNKNKRKIPAGIKLNPKLYDQYAGTYLDKEYGSTYIILRERNKLIGMPWENGPKTELIPKSELHFLAPGWPLAISFVKDKNGLVTQLVEDSDYGRAFKKIK